MGVYCCKDEGPQEITEQTDYNQNTYNNEDIFKTRPPCWFGHRCPCPCHQEGGLCIFKLKPK